MSNDKPRGRESSDVPRWRRLKGRHKGPFNLSYSFRAMEPTTSVPNATARRAEFALPLPGADLSWPLRGGKTIAPLRDVSCVRYRMLAYLWLALCFLCLRPSGFAAEVTGGPPRIRNVYIPTDQLKVLFGNASEGVLMSRDKILDLWQKAQRNAQPTTLPPADAVLTEAIYEARLEEHELRLTGRIEIAKLRRDWQTVDLPFGGVAIESARLGGQPARFGRKDADTLFLLLEKEGRTELELEMSAPLASKGGDLATTLKLPPVPASELLVRLDKARQLQVGETVLQPDSTDRDQQTYRVAVDRTGLVSLMVSDRFVSGKRAPLVFVNSRSIGQIEPAGLRWQVNLDLDVYARATDTFQLQLPDSVDVAEVEAPQLARWTIREEANGTTAVTLTFRKAVLGHRAVRLLGLAAVPLATKWNIPTVKVVGAASHIGQVLVYSSPSLRVDVGALAGIRAERLSRTSADTIPGANNSPLPFAFWDENFELPLRVTPRRRVVQASLATLVEVNRAGLTLRSGVTIEPRYAPLFSVRLQLPRDWEITSVLSADKPVPWESIPWLGTDVAVDELLQTIRFDLGKSLSPGRSLEITLAAQTHPDDWLKQDEGLSELPLPEVRLFGADEVEGTMLLQAPPDIELLVSDLSDDMQPVAADGAGRPSTQTSSTALQFRYQDDARVSGRLRIRTKPAKVSAETLAFVRLDRGKLDMHYQLDLHIRHGTIRQLRFTLPAAIGEKIHIIPVGSTARVIEQRHTRNAGENGAALDLWQIVLDQPVTGDLTLALDFEQTFSTQSPNDPSAPSAAGGLGPVKSGNPVVLPVLALQNVSRQSGIVAVEAAGDQQIDYKPQNLRDLDPADVLTPRAYVPSQRIVAAYQYQRLPYRLTISATRYASESVLNAICESAEIISVVSHQGRLRHQARFWLRSPNLQHVPVTLPENADLWSVLLDRQPVEVRQKEGTYLVPLPAGPAGTTSGTHELTLLYETESPPAAASGSRNRLQPRTIRQSAPEIGITTLSTLWQVYLPDGTNWVSSSGDFKPITVPTRRTLVTRLAETIVRQSITSLSWKFGGLVVAGIIVGFFALFKTGKGCAKRLIELVVVVCVIGVLIALLLPATQQAREAARRSQCKNNLKQIGLALHNYLDTYGQFPPAAIGPHNVPRDRQFSWIVAILPFLDQQPLYDQLRLDLPWDHPHNAQLLQVALESLLCSSDPAPSATPQGFFKTSYVATTGADSTYASGNTRGVIGYDGGLKFDDIVDGTANTILVAEVTDGGPWFAAGVGTARQIDDFLRKETWSHHAGGGNFLMADGSVRFLTTNIDPQDLCHLATAQGMDEIAGEEFGGKPVAMAPERTTSEAAVPSGPVSPAEKDEEAKRMTPPPTTAQNLPSPRPPQQVSLRRGERARLSLRVAIETNGGQAIRFRREGGSGELVLGLQDRSFALTLKWLMIAAALLVAWCRRRAPGSQQTIAVVLGLAVPVGLSGLTPLAWTPLLDGLLLGTLAAGGLWVLHRLITAIKSSAFGSAVAATAIGISLFLATDVSMAQETQTAGKTKAATQQVGRPNLTLFIPYDPEKDKPLQKTQVYLPRDKFLRLWKGAHPDKPAPLPPNVRAIVSRAEYSGQLQKDVARFDGRLLIYHLDDHWVRVVLPLGKVAIEKIAINGQPATLANADPARVRRLLLTVTTQTGKSSRPTLVGRPATASADDEAAIYLEKPGLHVVDVRFSVPVSRLGATGRMLLPLRPVSSGRLLFQLPADDLDVQVNGNSGGWRRQTLATDKEDAAGDSNGTFLSIPLGATKELSIRWQPRRVEARAEHLMSVDRAVLIEVLDSGIHVHSRFHYRIQQGTLSELQWHVPPDLAVQRVRGTEVADWSIETEPASGSKPQARRLIVSLKAEVTTGTDVEIDSFRRDRQMTGSIDIHTLEPLGIVRETGRVATGCSSHFRVRVVQTNHLDQIDRTGLDLPASSDDGCVLLSAYRYTSRPWRLGLEIERQRSRVEVSGRTIVAVTAHQAILRSLLTAHVTGAPVPSLTLRLPAKLRVSQVRVPPGADWFIDRDDQGQQLKVELKEPAVGKLNLAVSGSIVRDANQTEFAVPGLTVEEVQAQRGQLAICLDDDIETVLIDDGGARPIDPTALDSVLKPDGQQPVHYAFQYESPPSDLRLRLSPAPSRLNGDVTTVVSVRDGAVAYISQVAFEIRQAGRSHLRLVAPEWLGDDIELQGEQIRQISSQRSNDRRTWDIELQQPVQGTYRLQLIQTLPLESDGTVRAPTVRPLDVERSRSYVVLENLTADEIAATTTEGVTPISIAAVAETLTDPIRQQAVAAYRIADDDAVLRWQRRVREQETGLMASINLADLTTVVHADGRYRARAAYNIRNFTLQFLELELPPDSRLWSVHVSDQPVHPATVRRQGRSITLLPLQKTSAGDLSSKVVMIYSGRLAEPLRLWAQVRPPAPQILSDVPVSRTLWTLLLPREYAVSLVKGGSNLEQVAAAFQQQERNLSFLDELREMVQVAGIRGTSGARTKARYNLKQLGSALQNYAQQSAQVEATNAADVEKQAQQLQMEIRRLEELKTDAKRADGDPSHYFRQPEGGPTDVEFDQSFQKLLELGRPEEEDAAGKAVPKKTRDEVGGRVEQRRGKLRHQAAEQLTRLKTTQEPGSTQQKKTTEQKPAGVPEDEQRAAAVGLPPATPERTAEQRRRQGRSGASKPMAPARTGHLSLDFDLTPVGTAYHFRKLHGEPRLVLHVRHQRLTRWLSAIVWAGLCLVLATAMIQVLRRPNASVLVYRCWPWFAALTGTAWLFLLPAGVFGLALLVTASCVLVVRLQRTSQTGPAHESATKQSTRVLGK